MIGQIYQHLDGRFEPLDHHRVRAWVHGNEAGALTLICESHGLCDWDCPGSRAREHTFPLDGYTREPSELTGPVGEGCPTARGLTFRPWFHILTEAGDKIWVIPHVRGGIRIRVTFYWHTYILRDQPPYQENWKCTPSYNGNRDHQYEEYLQKGCHEDQVFRDWAYALRVLNDYLHLLTDPTAAMEILMDKMDEERASAYETTS